MHHQGSSGSAGFDGKVAVRDSIKRVGAGRSKAERGRCHVSIDRIGGASECGSPQWGLVQAGTTVAEASGIAIEHFVPRHEVMTEGDGLRHLQMGEAGHDGVCFLLGQGNDSSLQTVDFAEDAIDSGTGIEADIGRDLVVA